MGVLEKVGHVLKEKLKQLAAAGQLGGNWENPQSREANALIGSLRNP